MADDIFDDITKYDLVMGTDTIECPHCGAQVQCSAILDAEIKCTECGEVFTKEDVENDNDVKKK